MTSLVFLENPFLNECFSNVLLDSPHLIVDYNNEHFNFRMSLDV